MRTGRSLSAFGGGTCSGGLYLPGPGEGVGVPGPGGVYLVWGDLPGPGGVPGLGGYLVQGVYLVPGGVPGLAGCLLGTPPGTRPGTPLPGTWPGTPPCEQTDACKLITLAQLRCGR